MRDSSVDEKSYIGYAELAAKLPINKGDIILVSSDMLNILVDTKSHGETFDANVFIDSFLQQVGEDGTLLFPTFNWGFCRGEVFDINKTPSEVGALSNVALTRDDFNRTQHPIYSFAVAGRYKKDLCDLNNVSAWSETSPLGFFCRYNAKNLFIGIDYKEGFFLDHYCEEICKVEYRYFKEFTSKYVDINNRIDTRTYSMFVRDLNACKRTQISQELDEIMLQSGCYQKLALNGIPFSLIDMNRAAEIMISDISSSRQLIMSQPLP